MVKLRPHHLLCTQGYSGKGYSDGFVSNMDKVVDYLRYDENPRVELVFGPDVLCEDCPNRVEEVLCSTQEKVARFDAKTVEYFGLEEKEYGYREIVEEIDGKITEEILADICQGCSWYPISSCRRKICHRSE